MKNPAASTIATLADLDQFSSIIDVRTPLEFAEDHIPGAINAPVLSNEERVLVGTMYKQVSPFEATKVGAALVAKNIAHHLETLFADQPKDWKPLIYCWRGGKRSGSMTSWLRLIGWKAYQLDGGYKAWRHQVLADLDTLPGRYRYCVISGLTGSGKTRLLHALAASGAQVLDLEALANHRGSLLGAVPGQPQPSQKWFDTQLAHRLAQLDPARPVFVESESKRIGLVHLPAALMDALHAADGVRVQVNMDERVAFLCEDYAELLEQPQAFKAQLTRLTELLGRQTIQRWHQLIDQQDKATLFRELIEQHYDPAYRRSNGQLYPRLAEAPVFTFHPNAADMNGEVQRLLQQLIAG